MKTRINTSEEKTAKARLLKDAGWKYNTKLGVFQHGNYAQTLNKNTILNASVGGLMLLSTFEFEEPIKMIADILKKQQK